MEVKFTNELDKAVKSKTGCIDTYNSIRSDLDEIVKLNGICNDPILVNYYSAIMTQLAPQLDKSRNMLTFNTEEFIFE